ncbi:MAG: GYD domain-containing protein [Halobacteriales archaeon]|nr:GYD domain-containing protein [Halobacteriales archaeon]
MPTFVHLVTLTTEGLEHLTDYLTLGSYDIVSVTSFPDADAAAKFALAMAGEGQTWTETMRAFDVEAFRETFASLDAS